MHGLWEVRSLKVSGGRRGGSSTDAWALGGKIAKSTRSGGGGSASADAWALGGKIANGTRSEWGRVQVPSTDAWALGGEIAKGTRSWWMSNNALTTCKVAHHKTISSSCIFLSQYLVLVQFGDKKERQSLLLEIMLLQCFYQLLICALFCDKNRNFACNHRASFYCK